MKSFKLHTGFTIVELMIVLAILGVLASIGFPMLSNFRDNATIKGAAETALQALNTAKFESIKLNRNIYVSASSTCYGAGTATTCNCGTAGTCDIFTKNIAEFKSTAQSTSLSADSTTQFFEPRNGGFSATSTTCTPSLTCAAHITFSKNGKEIEVQLSSTGRVRECVKSGNIPGIASCS